MENSIKVIAYYLPQFHPFSENDEWWGKGFTEWTNVGKAKSLFYGHKQPVVPSELGYYDLRLAQVRELQVGLAKEAGIYGFCYWHYWFNGHQLMNEIIDDVLETGTPDFPFCLGWANETWKKKQWNVDGVGDEILLEQTYGGDADYRAHYEYVKPFFKDKRYIRIDGRPYFMIYKPLQFPDVSRFMTLWNQWVKEDSIADRVCFVASADLDKDITEIENLKFDYVVPQIFQKFGSMSRLDRLRDKILKIFCRIPAIVSYKHAIKHFCRYDFGDDKQLISTIIPRWDHTPRSGVKGFVLQGSTPSLFRQHAAEVIKFARNRGDRFVMLKSWNEWAEGNYMEPDLEYGRKYIEALNSAIGE